MNTFIIEFKQGDFKVDLEFTDRVLARETQLGLRKRFPEADVSFIGGTVITDITDPVWGGMLYFIENAVNKNHVDVSDDVKMREFIKNTYGINIWEKLYGEDFEKVVEAAHKRLADDYGIEILENVDLTESIAAKTFNEKED